MKNNFIGRREFLNYGFFASLFVLSGCSISKDSLYLRAVDNTFPSEFLESLPSPWKYFPIRNIESKKEPYHSNLIEKTDLLLLNDGWISDLPYELLQEIKADKIRQMLNTQANWFVNNLGENYKGKIVPLAASPWVILFRNADALDFNNENSWEVIFENKLAGQIVFPSSPYLLISIANKIGFLSDLPKLKKQAKAFDDRNALNWLVSGRAKAAVLPLSSCIDSLLRDPRLTAIIPVEGSPLNWTTLSLPKNSSASFPSEWLERLWGPVYSGMMIRKGFLPPIELLKLEKENRNIPKKKPFISLLDERIWNKCWSLPLLDSQGEKDLAETWNAS